MDKKNVKYTVIVVVIILFVITLVSLFNLNYLSRSRVYGSGLEERIERMQKEIYSLEKENSVLRTRTTALFVLVFLSLLLNIGIIAERFYSFHKNKKNRKTDKEAAQ